MTNTSDNAENNDTMHENLLNLLRNDFVFQNCLNVFNLKRFFHFAHVIQLILKVLKQILKKIHVNLKNADLRNN